MGDLFPAFRGQREEGQCVLLALAISQETLNNQYTTFAYLGAARPEPHHSPLPFYDLLMAPRDGTENQPADSKQREITIPPRTRS